MQRYANAKWISWTKQMCTKADLSDEKQKKKHRQTQRQSYTSYDLFTLSLSLFISLAAISSQLLQIKLNRNKFNMVLTHNLSTSINNFYHNLLLLIAENFKSFDCNIVLKHEFQ